MPAGRLRFPHGDRIARPGHVGGIPGLPADRNWVVVIDVCTGSGDLALALALLVLDTQVETDEFTGKSRAAGAAQCAPLAGAGQSRVRGGRPARMKRLPETSAVPGCAHSRTGAGSVQVLVAEA